MEMCIRDRKEYWGLGIGSLLLSAIISGAREMNYEQIELEVVCENEKAIALYKNCLLYTSTWPGCRNRIM